MLTAITWDRISLRKCAVYQQKWLEGHVALLPKSQFRGQCIHTAISLHDLRDASLQKNLQINIWIAQSKLAFMMLICVHMGQNTVIQMTVTPMIILIAHFGLVWKHFEREGNSSFKRPQDLTPYLSIHIIVQNIFLYDVLWLYDENFKWKCHIAMLYGEMMVKPSFCMKSLFPQCERQLHTTFIICARA